MSAEAAATASPESASPEEAGAAGGSLVMPAAVMDDLARRGAKGYPYEVCGLLLGERQGSQWRLVTATEGANLSEDRQQDRFILDPAHYLEADRIATEHGVDIVGVWHTHPDHPAVPSVTDLENAWANFAYLILPTRREGTGTGRTWLLENEEFVEIATETIP